MASCSCVGILLFVITSSISQGREDTSRADYVSPRALNRAIENGIVDVSTNNGAVASLLTVVSKGIVVRRAYLDKRRRDGHENAVVFFLEIKRSVTAKIFGGCRVGNEEMSHVRFRHAKEYDWAIQTKHVTKNLAFVDCYDVHDVKDGDPAYLIVNNYRIGSAVIKRGEVKSQQNLVVPIPRNRSSDPPPTVMVCLAPVHYGKIPPSEDGMLLQWLRYQKTIGIDHVHMIADDTYVIAGGMDNPYIQDAVKENYLSVDFWPRWFNETEIFFSSKELAYNDCLYQFMGVYDYIVYADSDDFFVPLKANKSVKTYLKKCCSGKDGTCEFQWRQFYPDCGWSPKSVGADGNLTATVHYSKTTQLGDKSTKSGHQIQALLDAGVHSSMVLMPGYKKREVPSKEAYFAHLRKGRFPSGGC